MVPSLDQVQRFSRLRYRIACPETEDFLSNMLFTSVSLRKKKIAKFTDAQKEIEQNLQLVLQREKKLQEEKTRLLQQLRTQSILHHREMSRVEMNLKQDARQLVSIHVSERSNAEERSIKLLQQSEQATLELERVKTKVESAQAEMQMAKLKVDELHGTIGMLQTAVEVEKSKANDAVNEIEANQEAIKSFQKKFDNFQHVIHERDGMISSVEETNRKLHGNLEDLFADMCSLAQMYEHNENQAESHKHQNTEAIEAVNQKLTKELKRNEKLTLKVADIEEENEKLYRKLGKYKERLEQERKGRREDQEKKKEEDHRRKRNGPVSYLNSLHTSTTSDMSLSRSKSTRSSRDQTLSSQRPPSQYKSRDRSLNDKENSDGNYRSSTSQRRARY
eukprot:CAMPEP_0201264104 /NCGR_PEP_ID=MMETSP0853-20130426/7782_1 /ASSEMBLY_ACC=CAM_ASM_000640 /TAXON_ID=183588 /ORGANISM="Pseudo-nitzschia fraudulenta, Strain WWA7" /LENGTH=390 /DNA_ID=CAMNT_0047567899 /DNA_START=122 /DNA_END=1294 /DNA_ORIENTATION=+